MLRYSEERVHRAVADKTRYYWCQFSPRVKETERPSIQSENLLPKGSLRRIVRVRRLCKLKAYKRPAPTSQSSNNAHIGR